MFLKYRGAQEKRLSPMDKEILAYLKANQKIGAIKYHRGLTNADLVTSKEYVEKVGRENGIE